MKDIIKSKEFKIAVISGLTVAVIWAVITFIYALIKEIDYSEAFNAIWSWIKAALTFRIAVYWILIIFVLILVTYLVIKIRKRNSVPKYLRYNRDQINGHTYTWGYSPDNTIEDLDCIKMECPKCQTTMQGKFSSPFANHTYRCPRCKEEITTDESNVDIFNIIQDNIRKQKYDKK